MKSFNWGDNYVTGLQDVDDQHQHLVGIINQLGQFIIEDNAPIEQLNGLIDKLVSYATYHFSDEEQMMAEKGIDPRHLTTHIEIHKCFLNEVADLASNISTENTQSAKQLFEFLIHWLSYHILGSDQDMARQLSCIANGLTPQEAYNKEEREKNQATQPILEALTELLDVVTRQNKELLKLNSSLEEKVAKRTEELLIANQHLEEVSLTDVLTKLPNRRHAMRRLVHLWQESNKNNTDLSCIMIDADYFKTINDNYGHDAGDKVLIELAHTLNTALRTDDTVCRLGGDEFLVICPCTDQAGAKQVAESLYQKVSNLNVLVGEGSWHGSISVGVATKTINIASYEDLLKMADNGLYAAKNDGRSCIRCSSS